MTTRGRLQRTSGVQNFHGAVHKWKRSWVLVGDENAPTTKKRMKLMKWVRTEERAETLMGPRFPHLVPLDKEFPGVRGELAVDRIVIPKRVAPPSPTKDSLPDEERSVEKQGSLCSGDFADLGFETVPSESTELSRENKPQTEPLTEGTSLTLDDDMTERSIPSLTDESLEDGKRD